MAGLESWRCAATCRTISKGLPNFKETRLKLVTLFDPDELYATLDSIADRWGDFDVSGVILLRFRTTCSFVLHENRLSCRFPSVYFQRGRPNLSARPESPGSVPVPEFRGAGKLSLRA